MLLSIIEFIGHFHPLLVHLPIGILLLALLLQWLSRKEQYTLSHSVMKIIWIIGVFAALLSCITGYLLSLSDDYEETTVSLHMWMAIALTAVALLICARIFAKKFDLVYKAASIVLLLLIFVTGHLGGTLTHGSGYLSLDFKAKKFASKPKIIANVQEARAYDDVVQPLLETKCYGCHGPNKQKGGLRLDDSLHLMKGGKDALALVPGSAEKSEMIKRILLPREDEHHMPPKEKAQLTDSQIALLHWWINSGADFSKKVKAFPQTDKIRSILFALQKPQQTVPSYVPQEKIQAADITAIEALKKKGVVILAVDQNSPYLMANFVTATSLKDEDLELLLPIKKQLVWLKLSDTKVSDNALKSVAECTNLRVLQLNNTAVTDQGLSQLHTIKNLQSLSLMGTAVTAAGLQSLQEIKTLREIFLYQTKAIKDVAALKKIFPKAIIDTGGYNIPFIPTDTTVVQAPKH